MTHDERAAALWAEFERLPGHWRTGTDRHMRALLVAAFREVAAAALRDVTPNPGADEAGLEDCDCVSVLVPVGQLRAALAALAKAKGDTP